MTLRCILYPKVRVMKYLLVFNRICELGAYTWVHLKISHMVYVGLSLRHIHEKSRGDRFVLFGRGFWVVNLINKRMGGLNC